MSVRLYFISSFQSSAFYCCLCILCPIRQESISVNIRSNRAPNMYIVSRSIDSFYPKASKRVYILFSPYFGLYFSASFSPTFECLGLNIQIIYRWGTERTYDACYIIITTNHIKVKINAFSS
jgi:hypothetical protein